MSQPPTESFTTLLHRSIEEIAPGLLGELIGWKFCRNCGSLCNWATAHFDALAESLICPECAALIVEWPPGLPILCACGTDCEDEHEVYNGLPISRCCDRVLTPPPEYIPDPVPHFLPPSTLPQPLQIAPSCPGVKGAEPLPRPQPSEGGC